MPASYAHYTFGSQVLSEIKNLSIKQLLLGHHDTYDIGLHGPDILFYYKPIKSNHVSKTGYALHDKTADNFFDHARQVIKQASSQEEKDAAMAYAIGFICHFALDSECHGYVDDMVKKLSVSHTKIESEFERLLLDKNHLNPITTRTTAHIMASEKCASCIAPFFQGLMSFEDITPEEILKALKSFKFYSNLLLAPHKPERALIDLILKLSGHYDFMHGLMISYKPEPKCETTNRELYRRYEQAIPVAVRLIQKFYEAADQDTPLPERFHRNFE